MKRKNIMAIFLALIIMLTSLVGCSSNEAIKDQVLTDAIFKEVEENGEKSLQYKAQITNTSLYNIVDVTFQVEVFKDGTPVKVIESFSSNELRVYHNDMIQVSGKIEVGLDFNEIKVTKLSYQAQSFIDTYLAYVIVMPIATIVFASILIFALLKNENDKIDAKRPSVIGILCLLILLTMSRTLGWIAIGFLFGAAVLVFLSGYITIRIRRNTLAKKALLNEVNEKALDAKVIDAEVVEEEPNTEDNEQ